METDEHDEFCWEQQMPGFLQKGVTITWFYQFTNSFFDSTDVLHLYCMFVSIQKNVVPWVCRRRTCHVLHAKLCESNGLSHFTIFFPFTSAWFLFPFVSGCFFKFLLCIYLLVCLKVNVIIEKNTRWILTETDHWVHCPTCTWVSKLFW